MTAIAVVRTPEFIVLAADGASVDALAQRKADPEPKIHWMGHFFYTAHGLVGNTNVGYDLRQLIADNSKHNTLGAIAQAVSEAAQGPLSKALSQTKREFPQQFQEMFSNKQAAFAASQEQNHLSILSLTFFIENLADVDIKLKAGVRRCPGPECASSCSDHPFVGPTDFRTKFDLEHPLWWAGSEKEVAAQAESLIQKTIDLGLPEYGPPISIVVIKPNGFYWYKNQGV
jgi:hypothetical protein